MFQRQSKDHQNRLTVALASSARIAAVRYLHLLPTDSANTQISSRSFGWHLSIYRDKAFLGLVSRITLAYLDASKKETYLV